MNSGQGPNHGATRPGTIDPRRDPPAERSFGRPSRGIRGGRPGAETNDEPGALSSTGLATLSAAGAIYGPTTIRRRDDSRPAALSRHR